jgi:hypothetical protein
VSVKEIETVFYFSFHFLLFGSPGVCTQDFRLARQVFYHLSNIPAFVAFVTFGIRSHIFSLILLFMLPGSKTIL